MIPGAVLMTMFCIAAAFVKAGGLVLFWFGFACPVDLTAQGSLFSLGEVKI